MRTESILTMKTASGNIPTLTLSSFRLIVSVSVIPEENGKGEIHCKLQTEGRLLDTSILRKMNL